MSALPMEYNACLDLFEKVRIDSSIEDITVAEIKPQLALTQTGSYTFRNDGCLHPILLRDVKLKMKCKLEQANGTALVAEEKCSTANYPLASIFSRVDFNLSGKNVGFTHSLHPYKAMLQELLYADESEEDGRLRMEGFIKDQAGLQLVADPEADTPNSGLVARRDELFGLSKPVVLMGGLHLDMFRQNRCLLPGVKFEVTLHRNDDQFVIIQAGTVAYKITILDLSLMVPVVRISEAMRRSLESVLINNSPALYNIDKTEMLSHFIPSGVTSHNISSLYQGKLPHTIVFAMATNASRNNDKTKNPFAFQTFGLKRLQLLKNNESVGYQNGLITDYGDGKVHTVAYYNYLKNTGCLEGQGRKPMISFEEFAAGYSIYPFKLCPASGVNTDTSALNVGGLSLFLEFTSAVTDALDLLIYSEFTETIQIDRAHNVHTED